MDNQTNHQQHTHHTQLQVRAMRDLSAHIPRNDFGLPTGVYRVDMLPFHAYEPPNGGAGVDGLPDADSDSDPGIVPRKGPESGNGQEMILAGDPSPSPSPDPNARGDINVRGETDARGVAVHRTAGFPTKLLEGAFVWLYYDEGYPTFGDGTPFWGRMEFEPGEAFMAFERYLHMPFGVNPDYHFSSDGDFNFDSEGNPVFPDSGPLDPQSHDDSPSEGPVAAKGTRSLMDLAVTVSPTQRSEDVMRVERRLQVYYHLYNWNLRAQAYDMFRVVQHRRQLEIRAIETQDSQYVNSQRLMHKLMAFMGDEERFWDMMTPKVALDMHKHLSQLQRVSAGLPANGPPSAKDMEGREGEGGSVEIAFKSVAQKANRHIINQGKKEGGQEDTDTLSLALQDPETAGVLQDLIIKVNR